MTAEPHQLDVCECGDYRIDHRGDGPCIYNQPANVGHGGAPNCFAFRLAWPAAATVNLFPENVCPGKPEDLK
jgi:hypothetical protein